MLERITGYKFYQQGLVSIAANITVLTRKSNFREGVTDKDGGLPGRFREEPLPETGKIIEKKDLAKMRDDYCRLRGRDAKGVPGKRTAGGKES